MNYIAGAINAAAAHKQANADNALSEHQGRVASNNAQLERWQAEDAVARGNLAVTQNRRKYASLRASQEASMAAKGLDISYGSPNAILTDTDYFGAYDENIIRSNSRREAWAHTVQADNYTNQVNMLHDQRKANNPWVQGMWGFTKGFVGAGGLTTNGGGANTLMTSSGTVAESWYGTNGSAGSGSYSTWG
jgi:hypothetical protein